MYERPTVSSAHYRDLRVLAQQRWFSSAILRLAGVGLASDFLQSRQVEMVSPFAKILCSNPRSGSSGSRAFLSIMSIIFLSKLETEGGG
jgi:hypothetical protein